MPLTPEKDEDNLDRERTKSKVSDLKLIRGGLDSGVTSGNWLMDLPVGSIFTVVDKNNRSNFITLQLEIHNKTEKTVLLYENLTDKMFGRVEPNRFVNSFQLVEVLYTPSKQEEENG